MLWPSSGPPSSPCPACTPPEDPFRNTRTRRHTEMTRPQLPSCNKRSPLACLTPQAGLAPPLSDSGSLSCDRKCFQESRQSPKVSEGMVSTSLPPRTAHSASRMRWLALSTEISARGSSHQPERAPCRQGASLHLHSASPGPSRARCSGLRSNIQGALLRGPPTSWSRI